MAKIRQFMPIICALMLASPAVRAADAVAVFAAASLTDCLKEIAAGYEKQSGSKVVFNFAASSFLERQIEEGATADIFFSADEARMDQLQQKGFIAEGTRKSRLSNTLVVVVANDSGLQVKSATNLLDSRFQRVALADPQTVPAGIYAKEFLQRKGLWTTLEGKVIPTDNVRAALSVVEAGNAEAGIVYKTDAAISRKVKIVFEVPQPEAPRISYPMAVLKDAPHPQPARVFLSFLSSPQADAVFRKFGFILLN